jgi:hypothetical protein
MKSAGVQPFNTLGAASAAAASDPESALSLPPSLGIGEDDTQAMDAAVAAVTRRAKEGRQMLLLFEDMSCPIARSWPPEELAR